MCLCWFSRWDDTELVREVLTENILTKKKLIATYGFSLILIFKICYRCIIYADFSGLVRMKHRLQPVFHELKENIICHLFRFLCDFYRKRPKFNIPVYTSFLFTFSLFHRGRPPNNVSYRNNRFEETFLCNGTIRVGIHQKWLKKDFHLHETFSEIRLIALLSKKDSCDYGKGGIAAKGGLLS